MSPHPREDDRRMISPRARGRASSLRAGAVAPGGTERFRRPGCDEYNTRPCRDRGRTKSLGRPTAPLGPRRDGRRFRPQPARRIRGISWHLGRPLGTVKLIRQVVKDDEVEVWRQVALLSVGGSLGVNARYWLGVAISQRVGTRFPWATLTINVTGS